MMIPIYILITNVMIMITFCVNVEPIHNAVSIENNDFKGI